MEKSTLKVSHPTLFDEKSGGAAFCSATACAIGATAITPAKMLPASSFSLKEDKHIVASPTASLLTSRPRFCSLRARHRFVGPMPKLRTALRRRIHLSPKRGEGHGP